MAIVIVPVTVVVVVVVVMVVVVVVGIVVVGMVVVAGKLVGGGVLPLVLFTTACREGTSKISARAINNDNAEGLGLGLGPVREVKRWPAAERLGLGGLSPSPLVFPFLA